MMVFRRPCLTVMIPDGVAGFTQARVMGSLLTPGLQDSDIIRQPSRNGILGRRLSEFLPLS